MDLDEDDEMQDSGPKILKGNQIKNIFLNQASEENKQPERTTIVSHDFGEKRNSVKYKNYGLTFVIKNAHSE